MIYLKRLKLYSLLKPFIKRPSSLYIFFEIESLKQWLSSIEIVLTLIVSYIDSFKIFNRTILKSLIWKPLLKPVIIIF